MPFLKDWVCMSRRAAHELGQDSVVPSALIWPFAILSPTASLVEVPPGMRSCEETSVLFGVSKETYFMGKQCLMMG